MAVLFIETSPVFYYDDSIFHHEPLINSSSSSSFSSLPPSADQYLQYYSTPLYPTYHPTYCLPSYISCSSTLSSIPVYQHHQTQPLLLCNTNPLYQGPQYSSLPPPPPSQPVLLVPVLSFQPPLAAEQSQVPPSVEIVPCDNDENCVEEVEKEVISQTTQEMVLSKRPTKPTNKGRCSFFGKFWKKKYQNEKMHKCKLSMKWVPKILAFSSEPIHPEGNKTSVMIKNIPNKFTENLVAWLDKFCKEENQKLHFGDLENKPALAYDFVYLPIDFNSKCNKGYAFVNFNEPIGAWILYKEYHNVKWEIFCSKKICDITYARIQGKEGLVNHFDRSTFICETDDYLPTYFEPCRDGSGKWVKQFTVGKRINPVPAISSNKSSHHGYCKHHPASIHLVA